MSISLWLSRLSSFLSISRSEPDPGGPGPSASPFAGEKVSRVIGSAEFWCFFNKGSKFMHLDLRKLEIPDEHVTDLLTMERGGGSHSRIVSSLISKTREVPRSQALGQ
jgi:hypothetical protein